MRGFCVCHTCRCTANERMVSFRSCRHRLYPYSVPGTASLVNMTLRCKWQKDQICCHQIHFFKLKMHLNPFSAQPWLRPDPAWGAYDAPPDPLGWGGGYPLPIPLPQIICLKFALQGYKTWQRASRSKYSAISSDARIVTVCFNANKVSFHKHPCRAIVCVTRRAWQSQTWGRRRRKSECQINLSHM